jgi:hypothetical protein
LVREPGSLDGLNTVNASNNITPATPLNARLTSVLAEGIKIATIRYAAAIHRIECHIPSHSRRRNPAANEPRIAPTVLMAERMPMLLPGSDANGSSPFIRKGKTAPNKRQAGPMAANEVRNSRKTYDPKPSSVGSMLRLCVSPVKTKGVTQSIAPPNTMSMTSVCGADEFHRANQEASHAPNARHANTTMSIAEKL